MRTGNAVSMRVSRRRSMSPLLKSRLLIDREYAFFGVSQSNTRYYPESPKLPRAAGSYLGTPSQLAEKREIVAPASCRLSRGRPALGRRDAGATLEEGRSR